MTFPNMSAHNKWYNAANKMAESASEMKIDKRADAATLRAVHQHYVMKNGFIMDASACPP